MKKILALLLALVMVFSLVACGDNGDKDTGSNDTQQSDTNNNDSDTQDNSNDDSTADDSDSETNDAAASGHVGYFDDEVDHFARDTYKIAYVIYQDSVMNTAHYTAMQSMEPVLNIEVTMFQATALADQFLTNLELVATQGYDGCVIEPYIDSAARIFELANELELKYVFIVNAYTDEEGHYLAPTVVLDQYKDGATQIEWLHENYKKYAPDMDTSKMALILLDYSANMALAQRCDGAKDKFVELYPDNKIFESDLVTAKLDMQSAYDQVAATLAANPDIEYWWISGCVEDLASGAATACEEYGLKGKALVTCSGANVLPGVWDSGYEGCWVSSYAVYNYNYVVPALCGVIALIDGRATWDTLWADQRREGDPYTGYVAGDQMIERDTYKDVEKNIMKEYGVTSA